MNFENLQLAVEELPRAEALEFTGIHKEYKSVKMVSNLLFALVLLIGGICTLVFSGELFSIRWWLVALTVPVAYFLVVLFFIHKSFIYKGYVIRERDIAFRSGWIFRSVTTVPFNRVQHCEIVQGPVEKSFDLCRIQIYTAGGSDSELMIPGLLYAEGEQIREHLLTKIAANAIQ
ncbi:MAG: PH domain-containing protein [Bacteroidota bacterium]